MYRYFLTVMFVVCVSWRQPFEAQAAPTVSGERTINLKVFVYDWEKKRVSLAIVTAITRTDGEPKSDCAYNADRAGFFELSPPSGDTLELFVTYGGYTVPVKGLSGQGSQTIGIRMHVTRAGRLTLQEYQRLLESLLKKYGNRVSDVVRREVGSEGFREHIKLQAAIELGEDPSTWKQNEVQRLTGRIHTIIGKLTH